MKLLFVCSANMLRSPTAEKLFSTWPDTETASAGILPAIQGTHEIEEEDVEWADIVFAMERRHASFIEGRFPDAIDGKRLVTLGIPDDYERDDPVLIRILRNKVGPYIT